MDSSPTLLADRFKLLRRLKPHMSLPIYLAEDQEDLKEVVIKLEAKNCRHQRLLHEYKQLTRLQGSPGVPTVKWFGGTEGHNVLVTELLGPSLQELYLYCGRRFSLKTVLLLAEQMIARVELCHAFDYVHRAIKPGHFLIGRDTSAHLVYLIGLDDCKRYRESATQTHISYSEGHKSICEARFSSINRLMGIQPSRRDDLESLGYLFVFFLCSGLPWDQRMSQNPRNASQIALETKTNTPTEELCRTTPREFALYLNYCRGLRFDMQPDYAYLRRMFREVFERENYREDFLYDWTVFNYVRGRQNRRKERERLEA